ncbi:MAG: hypothetical protein ACT4OL_04060 [Nitrospiraceae bacterium]
MATADTVPAKDLKGENTEGWSPLTGAARCFRCEGLMVIEQGFDSTGGASHLDFLARRCVQCGEVIDQVILQNRRLQFGNTFDPRQK